MSAPSTPEFPEAIWRGERARFVPEPAPAEPAPFAALVFPFYGDKVLLADIAGRGWCIPSGSVEGDEAPEDAARREAHEEAGATLTRLVPLGHYVLTDTKTGAVRHAAVFLAALGGFGQIPAGSESRGAQLFAIEDVAGAYFAWDPLLAAVFAWADERRERELRVGFPLGDLLQEE